MAKSLLLLKGLEAGAAKLYVLDENLLLLDGSCKTKSLLDAQNINQSRQTLIKMGKK